MFTGLVEEVGTVLRFVRRGEGAHLYVRARKVLEGTQIGDSISVNGACLTVVEMGEGSFAADCMPETLERTTIGSLKPGDPVNLERALALGERLGGHLVLGHVDAVAEVLSVKYRANALEVRVSLPVSLRPYLAPKGSVAIDGISLTVTDVTAEDFGLGLIPHTVAATTLRDVRPGQKVNVEADVLARYVWQALSAAGESNAVQALSKESSAQGGLTAERLQELGY